MLGKLMKYEFKATGRFFLPAFAALIIMAAVNRLLSAIGQSTSEVAGALSAFIAILLMGGVFALVIALTISRFRQNLLSNEGHLMMTLPVSTDSLILSKMFTASIWMLASTVVAVLAIVIMAGGIAPMDIRIFFDAAIDEMSLMGIAQSILVIVEILALIALSLFSSILMLYACMALGMIVNKHRGIFSFGMFIAITTIMQIVVAVLISVFAAFEVIFRVNNFFNTISAPAALQVVLLMSLVIGVIQCVIFYFITRYMLKSRLNI